MKFTRIAGAALGFVLAALTATGAFAQGTVPFQFQNAQTGTTYTFLNSDCSKLVTFSNASTIAVTLPAAGTTFFAGCFIDVKNISALSSGVVTITPTTSTIDGATTKVLGQNASIRITNNSANYFTVPAGQVPQVVQGSPNGTGGATSASTSLGLTLGNVPSFFTQFSTQYLTPWVWMQVAMTDGRLFWVPGWR